MIATLTGKEANARGQFYAFALIVAAMVAAAMPFWFNFSLHQAFHRPINEVSSGVLVNFRSYPHFITAQWAARTLPQVLFLIALFGGSSAIVSEREARTMSTLGAMGVPLRTIVLVKYAVVALYVTIAAVLTTVVILVHSAVEQMGVPVGSTLLASCVALLNAFAFLSVCFLASALASRAPFAALYALVIGFAVVGVLYPLGLNGMALPDGLYAADGSLDPVHLVRAVTVAIAIAAAALFAAVVVTQERGAA